MTMLTKFPKSKLAAVLASALAVLVIWGALAWPGWSEGSAASETTAAQQTGAGPTSAAPPAAPAPEGQPPVIIRRVYVVTRGSGDAAPPVRNEVPAAPPPPAVSAQAPSPAAPPTQPQPQPITQSRGS